MGLNKTYSMHQSQILLITPIPSINKVYSMIVDHGSQRSIASVAYISQVADSLDVAVSFTTNQETRVKKCI